MLKLIQTLFSWRKTSNENFNVLVRNKILPMLVKLKDNRIYIKIDSIDLPNHIRESSYEEKYDWLISELIWSFENHLQKTNHSFKKLFSVYKENERMKNGFRMFGKYFKTLWKK